MEIRRVHPADDFRAIANIYVRSWQTAYRGIVPDEYLDKLTVDRWESTLKNSPYDSFVLMDGMVYAGTSAIAPARDALMEGWGEIVSVYLLPKYFGKGVGESLMVAVLGAIKGAGYPGAYLWVLKDNARARRFYEKQGFALQGDRTDIVIGGKALTEVRYVRSF